MLSSLTSCFRLSRSRTRTNLSTKFRPSERPTAQPLFTPVPAPNTSNKMKLQKWSRDKKVNFVERITGRKTASNATSQISSPLSMEMGYSNAAKQLQDMLNEGEDAENMRRRALEKEELEEAIRVKEILEFCEKPEVLENEALEADEVSVEEISVKEVPMSIGSIDVCYGSSDTEAVYSVSEKVRFWNIWHNSNKSKNNIDKNGFPIRTEKNSHVNPVVFHGVPDAVLKINLTFATCQTKNEWIASLDYYIPEFLPQATAIATLAEQSVPTEITETSANVVSFNIDREETACAMTMHLLDSMASEHSLDYSRLNYSGLDNETPSVTRHLLDESTDQQDDFGINEINDDLILFSLPI